ncbi:MAG: helix-turn-helix transcriptional regulator [Halobacteriota archaeon]|nr:helix-turn-helix transcriptional regulator [Halobacteriota archaeon]
MGFLTERERDIMQMLKDGKTVNDIGKHLGVSNTSISRSVSNIRTKVIDLEDDIKFLINVGFLKIEDNRFEYISRDRDPKALAKK